MGGLVGGLGGVVVALCVLLILWADLWCLYDVVMRASDVDTFRRIVWVVVILGGNVLGAILYVWFGPGRTRWIGAASTDSLGSAP